MKKLFALLAVAAMLSAVFMPLGAADRKLGDVNGDSAVDLNDILMIRDCIFGAALTAEQKAACDVNGDGTVNIEDMLVVLSIIFGGEGNTQTATPPVASATPVPTSSGTTTPPVPKQLDLGLTQAQVEAVAGTPTRIIDASSSLKWLIYRNAKYTDFYMVRCNNGISDCLFYMGTGLANKTFPQEPEWYSDKNDSNKKYAAAIEKKDRPVPNPRNKDAIEALIFELCNAFRAQHGKTPFVWDAQLRDMARAHSQDMANRNNLSHINAQGKDPFDRMDDAGYRYWAGGENVACFYGFAPADPSIKLNDQWINSAAHRENMLDDDFTHLGTGFGEAFHGQDWLYATQLFSVPF
ncbi:MAG: CAP domain-containing protein [Clostridia bacterium]|nr:CAP domain-containing protein [Clostridia bacterium]